MKKSIYFLILFLLITAANKITGQTANLPYLENFDNYEEGTVLPEGWVTDSKSTIKIGAWNEAYCVPYSKPYYLQVNYNNATYPRNDWAFSVGFNMEAGKTYFTSFWLYAAGYTDGNKSEKIKFTIGQSQTKEGQTAVLEDISGKRFFEWTQFECSFTPQTSGIYYLGFNINSSTESNGICIDNLEVFAEDNPPAVQAAYITKGGIWSASNTNLKNHLRYIFPGESISFINKSKYASGYNWQTFGNPATSEEENPVITYTETGFYEPVLTATNYNSNDSYKDTVNIIIVGEEEVSDIVSNKEKYDGKSLYKPEDLMSNGYEYVSGINRYYNTFAEKYELPAEAELSINAVSLMLYEYKVATKDRSKAVVVKIYGDAEGVPDPEKVFGSHTTTMSKAFGTASVVEERKDCKIEFDNPVKVKGTFYISIEIDESVVASATTYLGAVCFYKADRDTKAFVYIPERDEQPTPDLKVGEGWYPIQELPYPFYELEGLSFYLAPHVTFPKKGSSSVKETNENTLNVYPTHFINSLTIESANENIEKVLIYDLKGKIIFESILNSQKLDIETSNWQNGVYIVHAISNGSYKPVKIVKF